ncbi:UNVERIFIED_CONTAM: hypothetical protein BEN50_21600 [Euhalothece sp. KZN 001]
MFDYLSPEGKKLVEDLESGFPNMPRQKLEETAKSLLILALASVGTAQKLREANEDHEDSMNRALADLKTLEEYIESLVNNRS